MEASEDPRIVYADILYHPHHQSEKRAHMPLADRAAQFSAYDALAGFFDMIDEEERFTEAETELDENARELLDRKLQRIAEAIRRGEQPRVCFTVFVPDERKAGGSYREITESVRQIDLVSQRIVLNRREGRGGLYAALDIGRILSIRCELTDGLDAQE